MIKILFYSGKDDMPGTEIANEWLLRGLETAQDNFSSIFATSKLFVQDGLIFQSAL